MQTSGVPRRSTGSGPAQPPGEAELMLLLASTAERRRPHEARLVWLAERADHDRLADLLESHRLLGLLGTRLEALGSLALPEPFRARLRATLEHGRHWSALQEAITRRLLERLADAGIAAVALKGAPLARAIHGDPALRPSADVDLLVSRRELQVAEAALRGEGYGPAPCDPATGWTPPLHRLLVDRRGRLPEVELHWRLHWHEKTFSEALLTRTGQAPGGRPAPADELAALLLFYARDGFVSLRYAADIAAWWEACGATLGPQALDPVIAAHPELRPALAAAAAVSERLVGVPAAGLSSRLSLGGRRVRAAARLAGWSEGRPSRQAMANSTLVDLLLAPGDATASAVLGRLFPPAPVLDRLYRLPPDAGARRMLLRAAHPLRLSLRYLVACWNIRGGRSWTPVPWEAPPKGAREAALARR